MNTTVINIKTEPEVKEKAQRLAEEMGLSLTSVINRYLKHFVKTKSITFQVDEEPSDYLVKMLKKSEKDIKEGKVSPGFTHAKDAIAWLKQK